MLFPSWMIQSVLTVMLLEFQVLNVYGSLEIPLNTTDMGDNFELESEIINCTAEEAFLTCENACGEFRSVYCSCDKYCNVYRSCCADYEIFCPNESKGSLLIADKFSESSIECASFSRGFYVIAGCPINNTDRQLSKNCSITSASPVTLRDTYLHFKNIFCYLCYGLSEANASKWKLGININSLRMRRTKYRGLTSFYTSGEFTWEVNNVAKYFGRRCDNGFIGTCPEGTNQHLIDLCHYVQQPVSEWYDSNMEDALYYDNKYCAVCNRPNRLGNSKCAYVRQDYFKNGMALKFNILMSINSPDNIVFTASFHFPLIKWTEMRCSGMDEVEPKNCSVTKCKESYELINNTCIRMESTVIKCMIVSMKLRRQNQSSEYNLTMFASQTKRISNLFLQKITDTSQMKAVSYNFSDTLRQNLHYVILTYPVHGNIPSSSSLFESYVRFIEKRDYMIESVGDLSICMKYTTAGCSNTSCWDYPTRTLKIGQGGPSNSMKSLMVNRVLYLFTIWIWMAIYYHM